MKIAVVSPWSVSGKVVGGTERFIVDIATELSNLGHQIEVFMLSGEDAVINNVKYTSLNILGKGVVASEYELEKLFGKISQNFFYEFADEIEKKIPLDDFDAVQINSILFLKAWQNKKRLFALHTNSFDLKLAWGDSAYKIIMDVMKEEALQPQTIFVSPSIHYASLFSRKIDKNVLYIPHAIDNSRLACKTSKEELLQKYGLDNKITLLLPSRLEANHKRPQILFKAVSMMSDDIKEKIQIVAAGVDFQYIDFKNKLEAYAAKHNINARFCRFGLDTMNEAYAMADVIVLPSKWEIFGYSALEALSMDKTTVLNNIPSFKEIAGENPNAHFFKNTSIELLKVLEPILKSECFTNTYNQNWLLNYDIKRWAQSYEKVLIDE